MNIAVIFLIAGLVILAIVGVALYVSDTTAETPENETQNMGGQAVRLGKGLCGNPGSPCAT